MSGEGGRISYSYDENGNMTSKRLGGREDTYVYDVQNNLTAYTGYDGYRQTYSYNALGEMYEKAVSGRGERVLLEEAVYGEKQLGTENSSDNWETTRYIYDSAMSVPQVLPENSNNGTTIYEYGLERIAAYTESEDNSVTKTQYIHNAGGSVVQTISGEITDSLSAKTAAPTIISYSYTPYGEQLSEAVSGFGYNAEYYDAATGMINLRARQYEPMTMRFSQEDIIRGSVVNPISLNRYLYCQNNPISFSDPTGMLVFNKLGNAVKSAAEAVKSTVKAVASKTVSTAAKVTAKVANTVSKVSTTVSKVSSTVSNVASNVSKAASTVSNVATSIASNSNSKIVQSVAKTVASTANKVTTAANKVTAVANKVTTVAKKVETVSTKVAEACDKIAANSWNEAKTNFASAAKEFNEAAKEVKQKVVCAVNAACNIVKEGIKAQIHQKIECLKSKSINDYFYEYLKNATYCTNPNNTTIPMIIGLEELIPKYLFPEGTTQIGLTISGGYVLETGFFINLAWDYEGNMGIFYGTNSGVSTPSLGVSASISHTNAETIRRLSGLSMQTGGSLGPIGAEGIFFKDPDTGKYYEGVSLSYSLVGLTAAEAYFEGSEAYFVTEPINILNIYHSMLDEIDEFVSSW